MPKILVGLGCLLAATGLVGPMMCGVGESYARKRAREDLMQTLQARLSPDELARAFAAPPGEESPANYARWQIEPALYSDIAGAYWACEHLGLATLFVATGVFVSISRRRYLDAAPSSVRIFVWSGMAVLGLSAASFPIVIKSDDARELRARFVQEFGSRMTPDELTRMFAIPPGERDQTAYMQEQLRAKIPHMCRWVWIGESLLIGAGLIAIGLAERRERRAEHIPPL